MNILYLSCHSILEHDEVKLFSELGHDVFSLQGSYMNPHSPADPKRPPIPEAKFHQQLMDVAGQCSKDNIHPELIEWADIVVVMHVDGWVVNNWSKFRKKPVIWRSIGQSSPYVEDRLSLCRKQGLKVVRYAPAESTIYGYIGADAVIHFYKDPDEFTNWNGILKDVITVAQSMKQRGTYCGFDIFDRVTRYFPRKLYGSGNGQSGIPGKELSYEDLKYAYRDHRVYFYTGTYPASYTLNFIEAFMTGIPIVAIGKRLADLHEYVMDTYEVENIITNTVTGFISNSESDLQQYVRNLLNDDALADAIGKNGREKAIQLFGKETVKRQWREFFGKL